MHAIPKTKVETLPNVCVRDISAVHGGIDVKAGFFGRVWLPRGFVHDAMELHNFARFGCG